MPGVGFRKLKNRIYHIFVFRISQALYLRKPPRTWGSNLYACCCQLIQLNC
jgi:hypothetical protein